MIYQETLVRACSSSDVKSSEYVQNLIIFCQNMVEVAIQIPIYVY